MERVPVAFVICSEFKVNDTKVAALDESFKDARSISGTENSPSCGPGSIHEEDPLSFCIYGKIENQIVTFVGCVKDAEIPADSIHLQTVERDPDVHWVKWSVRFRRTLKDKKALAHPFTKYFRNSSRLRCFLGDEEFQRLSATENAEFLKFNEKNPHVLEKFIEAALTEQASGREVFSAGELIGDARWGETEMDRGIDRFKINDRWVPWYSRLAQMLEPRLVGLFRIRTSIADGLVWTDGRTWEQFKSEHPEKIQWSDPFDELPDGDWEYRG